MQTFILMDPGNLSSGKDVDAEISSSNWNINQNQMASQLAHSDITAGNVSSPPQQPQISAAIAADTCLNDNIHKNAEQEDEDDDDGCVIDALVETYLEAHLPVRTANVPSFRPMQPYDPQSVTKTSNDNNDMNHQTSSIVCVCDRVMGGAAGSVNCGLCHNTIAVLFEQRRDKLVLLDQLDQTRRNLEEERQLTGRQVKENAKLLLRVKELEDAVDRQADEVVVLKKDVEVVTARLAREADERADIQAERDKIKMELEDLGRSLFEEANHMVSEARKETHQTKLSQQDLMAELDKTTVKLKKERMNALSLRRQFSLFSSKSMRRRSSEISGDLALLEIHDGHEKDGITKLPVGDELSSLDIESIPDTRMYLDFKQMLLRMRTIPDCTLQRLPSQIPFFKTCVDEFIEPCFKGSKITFKKILEAITNETLIIKLDTSISDASSISPVKHGDDDSRVSLTKLAVQNSSNNSLRSSSTNTPELSRSASPVKYWSNLISTSIQSNRNLCGCCGRESQCPFLLSLTSLNPSATTANASSSSYSYSSQNGNSKIYIDIWCRDKIYAVWEFYQFMRHIITTTEPQQDDAEEMQRTFISYLRCLKNVFYARIGVMSYYKQIDVLIGETVDETGPENHNNNNNDK